MKVELKHISFNSFISLQRVHNINSYFAIIIINTPILYNIYMIPISLFAVSKSKENIKNHINSFCI